MTVLAAPEKLTELFSPERIPHILAAAADVILILDAKGVILDISSSISGFDVDTLAGRRLADVSTVESRKKIESLLETPERAAPARRYEINHVLPGGAELPVLYTVARGKARGPILAMGRDLSPVARVQQSLVEAQQAAEESFLRLRGADARYRVLFNLASEAILVVDATSLKLLDVNPAAAALLDTTAGRLVGRRLSEAFHPSHQAEVEEQVLGLRMVGRIEGVRVRLSAGRECWMSAALVRENEGAQVILRLSATDGAVEGAAPTKSKALRLIEAMPDAFVMLDNDRRILDANPAFIKLADVASLTQARGQPVDRWLGRTSVEMDILFSNLREHRAVRSFLAAVRSEHGQVEEVSISGVATLSGEQPIYGLVVRPETRRRRHAVSGNGSSSEQGRSARELAELVGRVPLKELVRETTEITERLCIEASLKLTGDNRAAAAQMLGLSRQGLYDKLRRYEIVDVPESDEAT